MKYLTLVLFWCSCWILGHSQVILDPPQKHTFNGEIKTIATQSLIINGVDSENAIQSEFKVDKYPYSLRAFSKDGKLTKRAIVNGPLDTIFEIYSYKNSVVNEQIKFNKDGQELNRINFYYRPHRGLLVKKFTKDDSIVKYKFYRKREKIKKIKRKSYHKGKFEKSVEKIKYANDKLITRVVKNAKLNSSIHYTYNQDGELIGQNSETSNIVYVYGNNSWRMMKYSHVKGDLKMAIDYIYVLDDMKNMVKILSKHSGAKTAELIFNKIEYY